MIEFAREAYDDVVYAGYDGAPEEACGVLAGEYGEAESTVLEAHPTENAADTPEIRYYIDPEEQLAVIEEIEDSGLDVVGFYHTHPAGPTQPSETDAERAAWPGYSYAICAFDGYPYLGSWRWQGDEEGFEQEVVRVVDR
ncbi:M67 family metallopeptidase (plasmid) [Halolamina sp. CBA1230]|uniref:desampylase n=1 Tax=Halolamina sp. CBA1230 TaxID=1853690 RepID=UPI0009A24262|nr:desampylase [Halolamina sp. CBA1230]QKY21934.1 M67 family metallopeptidase [Halolamina sp. CBA1230]